MQLTHSWTKLRIFSHFSAHHKGTTRIFSWQCFEQRERDWCHHGRWQTSLDFLLLLGLTCTLCSCLCLIQEVPLPSKIYCYLSMLNTLSLDLPDLMNLREPNLRWVALPEGHLMIHSQAPHLHQGWGGYQELFWKWSAILYCTWPCSSIQGVYSVTFLLRFAMPSFPVADTCSVISSAESNGLSSGATYAAALTCCTAFFCFDPHWKWAALCITQRISWISFPKYGTCIFRSHRGLPVFSFHFCGKKYEMRLFVFYLERTCRYASRWQITGPLYWHGWLFAGVRLSHPLEHMWLSKSPNLPFLAHPVQLAWYNQISQNQWDVQWNILIIEAPSEGQRTG